MRFYTTHGLQNKIAAIPVVNRENRRYGYVFL